MKPTLSADGHKLQQKEDIHSESQNSQQEDIPPSEAPVVSLKLASPPRSPRKATSMIFFSKGAEKTEAIPTEIHFQNILPSASDEIPIIARPPSPNRISKSVTIDIPNKNETDQVALEKLPLIIAHETLTHKFLEIKPSLDLTNNINPGNATTVLRYAHVGKNYLENLFINPNGVVFTDSKTQLTGKRSYVIIEETTDKGVEHKVIIDSNGHYYLSLKKASLKSILNKEVVNKKILSMGLEERSHFINSIKNEEERKDFIKLIVQIVPMLDEEFEYFLRAIDERTTQKDMSELRALLYTPSNNISINIEKYINDFVLAHPDFHKPFKLEARFLQQIDISSCEHYKVIAAGSIEAHNGEIIRIDDQSGCFHSSKLEQLASQENARELFAIFNVFQKVFLNYEETREIDAAIKAAKSDNAELTDTELLAFTRRVIKEVKAKNTVKFQKRSRSAADLSGMESQSQEEKTTKLTTRRKVGSTGTLFDSRDSKAEIEEKQSPLPGVFL